MFFEFRSFLDGILKKFPTTKIFFVLAAISQTKYDLSEKKKSNS